MALLILINIRAGINKNGYIGAKKEGRRKRKKT